MSSALSLTTRSLQFTLKFTKGDIMVKLDKLFYLQEKHLDLRYDEVISSALSALDAAFQRVESARSGSAPAATPSPVPLESIGEPVPPLKDPSQATREAYTQDVLQLLKYNLDEASYLAGNRYLFWAAPKQVLAAVFAKRRLGSRKFANSKKPAHVIDVLRRVRDRLADLPSAPRTAWKTKLESAELRGAISADLQTIVVEGRERNHEDAPPPPPPKAGLDILRWALLAGSPGTTVWEILSLFGKEESLRRLDCAILVAEEEMEMGHPVDINEEGSS